MHMDSLVSLRAMRPRLVWILALLFAAPSYCTYNLAVVENTEANVLIGTLGHNVSSFSESNDACLPYVSISEGELRTAVRLDREVFCGNKSVCGNIILVCNVKLSGTVELIHIRILDLNDNVPRFSELEKVHIFNVTENFNIPNPILDLQPVDKDERANGTVEFNITTGNEERFFYIGPPLDATKSDENETKLFFNRTVDFEEYQIFNLTISLCDKGTPPLCFEQIVIIYIDDVNDEDPIFIITEFTFNVSENHSLGPLHPFGIVTALDQDSVNSQKIYELEGEPNPPNAFEYVDINRETGELYLKQAIDYESDPGLLNIKFSIRVNEQNRTHIDIAQIEIHVTNVNDEHPEVGLSHSPVGLPENKDLQQYPILFSASDIEGGISGYNVHLQPPLETMATKLGARLYRIVINAVLDREKVETVTLNFTAYDDGIPPLGTSKTIHLMVLDENDNSPNFSQVAYNALVGENTPLQNIAVSVEASDPDFAENGSVSYAITSVNPTVAQTWFDIDTLTGDIAINSPLNYSVVENVSITVTASDNGTSSQRSTNTTVTISISPAVSFKPRSYQEHCSPNTKIQDTSKIYLEFRTGKKSGLLLYEETEQDELFVLGIEDGQLIATTQNQVQTRTDIYEIDVSTNKWISVLYNSEQKSLEAWYTEEDRTKERTDILNASKVVRCDVSTQSTSQTFFVGGIDVFSHSDNSTGNGGDFVGIIRNLIIDGTQVDLASPVREENTARGALFTSETKCEELEMVCGGPHYTGCLDYDMESHCICVGGFNTEACNKEDDYAPIQLASSSMVKLVVEDYSLFYDLVQRSRLVGAATGESRRRRSLTDTVGYQLVEFDFILKRNSTGTLLYSQTDSAIHTLQIRGPSSKTATEYSMLYTVSDTDFTSDQVYITKMLNYQLGELNTVVINMTTTDISVSFNGQKPTVKLWNTIAPFIQYPKTLISLGGTDNPEIKMRSNFTGCIVRLAVNKIEFPLNGLVENNDSSVHISGGSDSSVSTTCDLCQQEVSPCQGDMNCINHFDSFECECPAGKIADDKGQCNDIPTTRSPPNESPTVSATDGLLNPTVSEGIPLYYIIGGGAGASVAIAALVTVVCCVFCKRHQRQNQKKRYHVGGENQLPRLGNGERSTPNSYSDVTRRPSLCNSEGGYMMVSRHNHDSSVSTTCNEHDIDEDTESNTQNMTRSKSSTSGETGFHTASERDDQRSIPRMEDSGNEKETDYSPFDSESDESQSYIGVHSTANVRLGRSKARGLTLQPVTTSPLESSGPVSSIGAPLTPKEKKFITPLRPDSRSELGEETDLDTDFSSTTLGPQTRFGRAYRGGSLKLPGRPDSGLSGQQWYKVSTSSDMERERKRAEGKSVHYPPSQFYSFRHARAASASSPPPQCNSVPRASSLSHKSASPPNLPHMQTSRPKRTIHTVTPPTTSPTSFNHHGALISPRNHQERDAGKGSESSALSTAVLSRSQPLKLRHPFFRESSSDSPRIPPHLAARPYMPHYMRSYSEESTRKGEEKFVDLASVRTNCDPIQYYEGQKRMMATVDQVDAYPVLSEMFTPFEDSAGESQQSGPEHQSFSSQGGGEGTAEVLDMGLLRDCETDTVVTGTTLKGSEAESKLMLFPSADCSEEYRHTPQILSTVGSPSPSVTDVAHQSFSIPPSQGTFEV